MHQTHTLSDRHLCEWRLVSSDHYSREQDTREKLVLRQVRGVPDQIDYYMVSSIKLQYTMPDAEAELRVRGAWISLRCTQPSIGLVAKGTQMRFTVLDASGMDAWASDTFFVHPSAQSALALSSNLEPTTGMRLHFLPRTKEVLMCASHEHVDGHGLVMLLDRLCRLIAFPSPPQLEDQGERLSPPLDVAAVIENASPEMWNRTQSLLQEWKARAARPLFIATDLPGPGVSGVSTIHLVLSSEDSAAVLSLAKASEVNVNDLINGIVIMTVKQYGSLKEGNWLGGIVMDARHSCRHPFNTRDHAATVCFVTCPAYVENPGSIVDAARQIKRQRLGFHQDPEALRIMQPLLAMTSAGADKSRYQRPQAISQSQVEYSGLGKLDGLLERVHGDIEIIDFWLSIGHCTEAIGVYCYAYRERLRFTLSYNSGFHSQTSMSEFMRKLEALVQRLISGSLVQGNEDVASGTCAESH